MAITAGQDILASDFITESERNGTKSNDSGRVPQLESDGYLSKAFLQDHSVRVKLTTDYGLAVVNQQNGIPWDSEDFDTASIHDNTASANIYDESGDNTDNEATTNTHWFAQEFTTGASQRNVIRIQINGRHTLDDSNNIELAIRSSLTGADLYSSGTISFNGSGTSSTQLTHYVPSYVLSPSTLYYLIIKTISQPSSGKFNMREDSAGTGGHKSTDSGANWASTGNGYTATVQCATRQYFTAPVAGKYLIIGNINSGVSQDKLLSVKVNNTQVAATRFGSGGTDMGGAISTIYTLAAGDVVHLMVQSNGGAGDDILASGSSFEMIRLQ